MCWFSETTAGCLRLAMSVNNVQVLVQCSMHEITNKLTVGLKTAFKTPLNSPYLNHKLYINVDQERRVNGWSGG